MVSDILRKIIGFIIWLWSHKRTYYIIQQYGCNCKCSDIWRNILQTDEWNDEGNLNTVKAQLLVVLEFSNASIIIYWIYKWSIQWISIDKVRDILSENNIATLCKMLGWFEFVSLL